jgi:hypothetical protein
MGEYTLTALDGPAVGEISGNLSGASAWSLSILPLVEWTVPTNGTTAFDPSQNVSLGFGFVMNTTAVEDALSVTPSVGLETEWNPSRTELTLRAPSGWPSGQSVEISVGTKASTSGGLAPQSPFELLFTT